MSRTIDTPGRRAPVPLWLVYCLLAVCAFAAWGLLSTAASRRLSAWEVQVFSTFGLVPVAIAAALSPGLWTGSNRRRGIAWAFLTGAGTAVANIALFAALGQGAEASIIFPLTGMYPLVTILVAAVLLRERVSGVQKVGLGLAMLAILLFSQADDAPQTVASAGAAPMRAVWMMLSVVCLLGWGLTGVTLKLATRDISPTLSIVCFVAANLLIVPAIGLPYALNWGAGWWPWVLCLLVGATFGLASLLIFAAYPAGGKVSVVTTLTALYPAITVIFAVPLFGERVTLVKSLGIVLALAAGVMLSRESDPS
ncbi:MAG: DMT family transporter [Planctomycetaceae bacterium]